MFGRLAQASGFKRWNGALLLVIELPDGSPGTIRADATDVCSARRPGGDGVAVVLSAEGLRRLRSLVFALADGSVPGGSVR